MHVAVFTGDFQCATLLSWEYGLGIKLMNLAVLCGDFRMCWCLKGKKKKEGA